MSKTKSDGLDQYGAEPFKQQQFGTAGIVGVKWDPYSGKPLGLGIPRTGYFYWSDALPA